MEVVRVQQAQVMKSPIQRCHEALADANVCPRMPEGPAIRLKSRFRSRQCSCYYTLPAFWNDGALSYN